MQRLKDGSILKPDEAAERLIKAFEEVKKYERGSFLDVRIMQDSPPDPCGTRQERVGCYVPVLTRCPLKPLHRSKGEHSDRRNGLNATLFF